jgi:multiple sugar transport system substrate-binding protein
VAVVDYVKGTTDTWLTDTIVPAFKAAHPEVSDVQFIWLTWGTYNDVLAGYFNTGTGPDIINFGSEYIAQYGDKLADLTSYLGSNAWPDYAQYIPSTLAGLTVNGKLEGLPWLIAPRAYMCNMTELQAAGITSVPTDYAGWIKEAKDATIIKDNALQQAGLVVTGKLDDWQEYIGLIWGLGGNLYNADGTSNFSSKEGQAALKFMYDRRRAEYPSETVADLPATTGNRLSDGSAACVLGNMWGFPAATDPVWANIQLAPWPTSADFPNSKPISMVFQDWLGVPAYSKNVALAADFLKMLGTADNQYTYNQGFGSFSPRKDAWHGYTDTTLMKSIGNIMAQYGVTFSDVRDTAKLVTILQREMPAYFTDTEDLATAVANIDSDYTKALTDDGWIH